LRSRNDNPNPLSRLRDFEIVLVSVIMVTKELIGARVRRLRREKTALNQAELARAISIDPATLNQIEQGKRQPSAQTITRLAEYLGVSRDYLMDGAPAQGQSAPNHASAEPTTAPETIAPRQGVNFSAAIQAEIYATLASIFGQLAADLEDRGETHLDREIAPPRTAQRPPRAQSG
jgi:transcriptional regulator with XRE-family HTH domain